MMSSNLRSPLLLTLLVGFLAIPQSASAYVLPEEVLLSEEFFLPPNSRETDLRATTQARESARRREEEQNAFFAIQHPPEPEVEELHASAPDEEFSDLGLTANDLELITTLRLLDRIDRNQAQLYGAAPVNPNPLAPTGAGGILTVLTMLGATGYTLRKAGKAKAIKAA